MKNKYGLGFLLTILMLMSGCESDFIARPVPVDAPDETRFPKRMQGNWMNDDSLTIEIRNTFVRVIVTEHVNVLKGNNKVTNLDQKQDILYTPFYTINTDAAGRTTDTAFHYKIHGQRIFHIGEYGGLEAGYPFTSSGDTIRINKSDTIRYDLGVNARLRMAGPDLYILCLNGSTDQQSGWWTIYPFQVNRKDSMTLYDLSDKFRSLPDMFHYSGTKDHGGSWYYDPYWTRDDIMRFLNEDYFNVSSGIKKM